MCAEFIPDIIFSLARFTGINLSSLYLSKGIAGINKSFIRAVLALGALPLEAYIRADAVIKAVFRSAFSKKHLLQWKTAADADSEKAENIFIYTVFPLLCFVFMLIAGSIVHRLFALCFLVFIVFLQKADKEISESRQEISEKEREKVLSWTEKSWQYFSENVTAEENFLPPDNIQEEPVFRVAHRTSPTNIGLYLVSALAAADMKIIGYKELLDRVSKTIDTVEGLPKYKGLLYNWYDTVTAEPLKPYYLSSVDCGNFLVCLVALKEGLEEYGKYDNGFYEAKKRTENIIAGSELAFLFDEKRQLFRIGFDCEKNEKSPSCYDLYMCEARMSSYYACGKRLVPAVHWGILDRALKRRCRYTAAASWSGTMFEYFMPALFLPHPDESFSREGLEVCLYMQRKTARKRGTPYGISESCCYSIDPSQNYRYKAHGIKALALKPDCFDENAVSPYSTFLSLPFDKNAAIKNLELLSSCNATGRYGFYEAVDFCKGHTGEEKYKTVRCFMAHHIGMSITAAANALCDDIFVRRFISDGEMASAVSLLEEKLPFPCDLFSSLKESFTEKLLFPRKHNKTESDVYKNESGADNTAVNSEN